MTPTARQGHGTLRIALWNVNKSMFSESILLQVLETQVNEVVSKRLGKVQVLLADCSKGKGNSMESKKKC